MSFRLIGLSNVNRRLAKKHPDIPIAPDSYRDGTGAPRFNKWNDVYAHRLLGLIEK